MTVVIKETEHFTWREDTIPRGWARVRRPLTVRKMAGPFWSVSLMAYDTQINALLGDDGAPPMELTFHDSARTRVLSWLRWYCTAADFAVILGQLK